MSAADAPAASATTARPGGLRLILGMMFSPAQVLQAQADHLPAALSLGVSGAAFTLFFLQTGLDQWRTGQADLGEALGLVPVGAVYGVGGVGAVAVVAWILTRPFLQQKGLGWTIRAYALAYAPALVYGVCGLVFSLFGWRTAVAFGVTGVLWAMHPLLAVNDELTGQRRLASGLLTALLGCVMLVGWSLLGTH